MKLKIALAAALMLLPAAAAAQPLTAVQVVEGHTVFVHLTPDGSTLAAVAGSVECEVKWFNDAVLFRVPAGTTGMCGDHRFIYAYPAGAPDPRQNPTLQPTERVWDFIDPNGAPWHVVEYQYQQLQVQVNQNLGLPDFLGENMTLEQVNYTAWVVEAGPSVYEPTLKEDYNFVLLVDTAKMRVSRTPAMGVDDPTPPQAPDPRSFGATTGRTPAGEATGKTWVTLALGETPPWYS